MVSAASYNTRQAANPEIIYSELLFALICFLDPIWIDLGVFFLLFLIAKADSNMEKLPEWSRCLYMRYRQGAMRAAPKQAVFAAALP